MNKVLEFVKVAGTWFYWLPNFIGDPYELSMIRGADKLLDSIDTKFARVKLLPTSNNADIILKKLEENSEGATYSCISRGYKGSVWICSITLEVLGEYPNAIYLKIL